MDSVQFVKDMLVALKSELIRFRAGAALLFTLVFAAVLAVAINWPKNYTSEAMVSVDVTNVIEPLLRGAAEMSDVSKNEKVSDIVRSRRILEQVVIQRNPDLANAPPDVLEEELVNVRRNLASSTLPGSAHINRISYSSSTPDDAYETLNAIVDAFIADRRDEKMRESYNAHSFISDQVVRYKERLETADQRLKAFRSRSADVTEDAVRSRVTELTGQIQDLRISINESEAKVRTTRAQLVQENRTATARAHLKSLEDRKVLLTDELDRLRLTYQDSYPDVVTLRTQISELNQIIDTVREQHGLGSSNQVSELPLLEELRKQLSTAEVDLSTQQRRLVALEDLLEQQFELSNRVAANQAELTDLTRDYNVTKRVYEEMLARKENATLTLALNDEGQGRTYRVLQPPMFPLNPSGLSALLIFAAAPLVAFAAPVGLALVFVVLDPRVRSVTILSQKLPPGVALVGRIPHRGSSIGARLLRKDMLLLALLAILLLAVYIYTYQTYGADF